VTLKFFFFSKTIDDVAVPVSTEFSKIVYQKKNNRFDANKHTTAAVFFAGILYAGKNTKLATPFDRRRRHNSGKILI